MNNIPVLRRFSGNADKMVAVLSDDIAKIAAKSTSRLASMVSSLSTALGVVKIAFVIADFYTGYQDARTTLGIIEKPTESQRLISGLIRVVKNLVPVIGALIPDKALVDLFVNKLAPILGIDTTDIQRQRDEAKIVVGNYNKKHGTDYTIEDYNKKVLNDYTTGEKISNFVKSVKSNIKEKGFVGAIKSGAEEYVNDAKDTFNKNYEEGGIIPAIAETLGSLFPSYIGDGLKGVTYMTDMAIKGDVKGVATYSPVDKDANALTKILGQASVIVTKLPLTGVALIVAGVKKVLELLNLDNMDSIKEAGSDIASVFKKAVTGDIVGMYTTDGGAEGDNTFASIVKNIGLAIPKVALTPVALVTTGVRKVLELLNLDNIDSLKEAENKQ